MPWPRRPGKEAEAMNVPTLVIGLIVLAVFVAIVARGVYNKTHHRGGCSCSGGCGNCPGSGMCHPER